MEGWREIDRDGVNISFYRSIFNTHTHTHTHTELSVMATHNSNNTEEQRTKKCLPTTAKVIKACTHDKPTHTHTPHTLTLIHTHALTHSHTHITLMHTPTLTQTVHGKELVTYEEMVKIEPQVNRPRPIMLVGE